MRSNSFGGPTAPFVCFKNKRQGTLPVSWEGEASRGKYANGRGGGAGGGRDRNRLTRCVRKYRIAEKKSR